MAATKTPTKPVTKYFVEYYGVHFKGKDWARLKNGGFDTHHAAQQHINKERNMHKATIKDWRVVSEEVSQ